MPPAVIGAKPLSVIPRSLLRGGFIKSLKEYVEVKAEVPRILDVEDDYVAESFMGATIRIPWDVFHGFTRDKERIMLHYFGRSAFIIPLRFLKKEQYDFLIGMLGAKKKKEMT